MGWLLWSNKHTKENTNSSSKRLSEFHASLGFQNRLWRAPSPYKSGQRRNEHQEPAWGHEGGIVADPTDGMLWTGTEKNASWMPISHQAHIKSRNNISCNPYPNPVSQIFFKSKFATWGHQGLRKSCNLPNVKQLISCRTGIPMS